MAKNAETWRPARGLPQCKTDRISPVREARRQTIWDTARRAGDAAVGVPTGVAALVGGWSAPTTGQAAMGGPPKAEMGRGKGRHLLNCFERVARSLPNQLD